MLIHEFAGAESQSGRLAALAQFLTGRAQDKNAQKKISVPAFLNLSKNLGISLTADQLRDMSLQPPLNGIIASVQNDEVVFRGADDQTKVSPQMTVDQARDTVNSMATRANPLT